MKRGTPRHPKMYALAESLHIPHTQAIGIMELFWHFAGESTPRGNIGILPDEAIAFGVMWPAKKATILVDALVKCGWLDRHTEHRLVIHDWEQHAEDLVRKKLARNGKDFVSGTVREIKPHVYFVRGMESGNIKIGYTEGSVELRVAMLQNNSAERLSLLGAILGFRTEERRLHQRFSALAIGGEWFRPSKELSDYITSTLDGSRCHPYMADVVAPTCEAEAEAKALDLPKEEKTEKPDSLYETALHVTAQELYDRHPAVRRCGISEIEKQLRGICRPLKVYEKIPKLLAIDSNHKAWCETEQWQKEGGEFAKALVNWLAPTMGRFDEPPPAPLPPRKSKLDEQMDRILNL